MILDLLVTVQQKLGYPELQKIDPNTQQVVEDDATPDEHKFSQAAIPAVLTGLYNYVQSDEGATDFLQSDATTQWLPKIFNESRQEAVQKISAYAKQSNADPLQKINSIAHEAVKVVKENLPVNALPADVKLFMNSQKQNILLYLPASLNMGELLNDNTLDDATNKMEGPISSLMQSIGSVFSNTTTDTDVKKQE